MWYLGVVFGRHVAGIDDDDDADEEPRGNQKKARGNQQKTKGKPKENQRKQ